MKKFTKILIVTVFSLNFSAAFANFGGVTGDLLDNRVALSGQNAAKAFASETIRNDPGYKEISQKLPAPTHHYASTLACQTSINNENRCHPIGCTAANGEQGVLSILLQAPIDKNPSGIGTVIDTADAAALNQWQRVGSYCSADLPAAKASLIAQTITLSVEDVKALGLKPATLHGPKNDGLTLINYETNIWVEAKEQSVETDVAGVHVLAKVHPVRFNFDYGDGTTLQTNSPGHDLSEDQWDVKTDTTHVYQQTGTYQAKVTCVYQGEFSVDGGATWIPLTGEAELAGDPVPVDVWRTDTYLVKHDK